MVYQLVTFVRTRRQLLLWLALLLTGVLLGTRFYAVYGVKEAQFLQTVLALQPVDAGWGGIARAVYDSLFLPVTLLIVLFFCGLSACGAPLIVAVPLFFGLGLGMSEAYYYSTGWQGVVSALIILLPQMFLKTAALIPAVGESMRMTLRLSRTLFHSETAVDMQTHFRVYVLRFLVCGCIALLGGILDVLLRMWWIG